MYLRRNLRVYITRFCQTFFYPRMNVPYDTPQYANTAAVGKESRVCIVARLPILTKKKQQQQQQQQQQRDWCSLAGR